MKQVFLALVFVLFFIGSQFRSYFLALDAIDEERSACEAEHELIETKLRDDLVTAKAAVRALVYLHNSEDDFGTHDDKLYVCDETYEIGNPAYAARVMETLLRPNCNKHEVLVTFSIFYDESGRNGTLGEPEVIPHSEGRPDILGAILR